MRSSGDFSGPERQPGRSQTDNPQRDRGHCPNQLFVVGIGPGSQEHLTKRAIDVLEMVDVVAGYHTYIELIHPLVEGKTVISTGMTQEVKRVEAAIEHARNARACAIVSSGDPGIYAMAGLVFEMCQSRQIAIVAPADTDRPDRHKSSLPIEVVPGIPALCAGAALLGAPLTHDFAAISLSDLLTPWQKIEQRLKAAARADFVIVIYNPKSKRRGGHLEKAQQIIAGHRHPDTPVGIVSRATRAGQRVQITTLDKLHTAEVDMQTTVFIGSSASRRYLDYIVTPRGYSDKYRIDGRPPDD